VPAWSPIAEFWYEATPRQEPSRVAADHPVSEVAGLDRRAKYNRLIEIERELGPKARFARPSIPGDSEADISKFQPQSKAGRRHTCVVRSP
jgi:hypothetical protein